MTQAMKVYRLADSTGTERDPSATRYYLDGKRVSRSQFGAASFMRRTDSYCSRLETRRDGCTVVREFHNIRSA